MSKVVEVRYDRFLALGPTRGPIRWPACDERRRRPRLPDPTRGTCCSGRSACDIYLGRDLILPGGGVLNMAWHWRQAGLPFHLLTRIGDDRPEVFLDFLDRHGIPYSAGSIVGAGPSAVDRHRHPAGPTAAHGPLRRGRVGRTCALDATRRAALVAARGGSMRPGRGRRSPRLDRLGDAGAAASARRCRPTSSASATTRSSGSPGRWPMSTSASSAGRAHRTTRRVAGIRATVVAAASKLVVVTLGVARRPRAGRPRRAADERFVPVTPGRGHGHDRRAAATRSSPRSWRGYWGDGDGRRRRP